jgi:hypothetical protein
MEPTSPIATLEKPKRFGFYYGGLDSPPTSAGVQDMSGNEHIDDRSPVSRAPEILEQKEICRIAISGGEQCPDFILR